MALDFAPLHTFGAALTRALVAEATDSILVPAQQRIPVETGRARESGRVMTEATSVWVTFGRDDDGNGGAPSNAYIEVLEEDSEARHPQGQAHFLRTSADEASAGFVDRLARRVPG